MPAPTERLDFSELDVLDHHCHLFSPSPAEQNLAGAFSMSLNRMPEEQLAQTTIYRLVIKELGSFLDLPPAGDREILALRRERMLADYQGWVSDLFADVRLKTLLVDLGYQAAAQNLDDFEGTLPARAGYIFRIETILDGLWEEVHTGGIDFRRAEERFDEALEEGLARPGIVGLKSIIGYRTGLEIRPWTRSHLLREVPGEQAFRDYFFIRSLQKAADRGMPVQIHASFGESNIDIRRNHPGMLKWVFEQTEFWEAPLVLVHGGYPHCFEAGYLASVFPQVYVDFSEMVPFVPLGAARGLRDILDMCPHNKILYGSDGSVIPEIHWLGARMAKDLLTDIFTEFVKRGLFDAELARSTAAMILQDNARTLYRLE